jgi:hypothetical protein
VRKGRYYVGRVVKAGLITQETLQDIILNPPVVEKGRFGWTITDIEDHRSGSIPFIFGKLSKFSRVGQLTVVDEGTKSQRAALEPNLLEASSPFVYLPKFSGIAYLHVWNGIQEEVFARRFRAIIEAPFDSVFAECAIEPIADYEVFVKKLYNIDTFTEISAKVYPPNPLFGRLWSSLNDYVKMRNAAEVSIKETSPDDKGITTNIVTLVRNIMSNSNYQPDIAVDIADAALLMAADGYGKGKVVGFNGNTEVIIRTSDNQKSFLAEIEPEPLELAIKATAIFEKISTERDMRH